MVISNATRKFMIPFASNYGTTLFRINLDFNRNFGANSVRNCEFGQNPLSLSICRGRANFIIFLHYVQMGFYISVVVKNVMLYQTSPTANWHLCLKACTDFIPGVTSLSKTSLGIPILTQCKVINEHSVALCFQSFLVKIEQLPKSVSAKEINQYFWG